MEGRKFHYRRPHAGAGCAPLPSAHPLMWPHLPLLRCGQNGKALSFCAKPEMTIRTLGYTRTNRKR